MKLKISIPKKKLRLPRLKKQARIPILIAICVILVALGLLFHILPGPGSLAHFFEAKTSTESLQSVGGATTGLAEPLAPPLIADFLASPGYQSNPLSVQFFDMSRGSPGAWQWDFGDNSSSSLQYPVHEYASGGLYNVALTVTRQDGARETVTVDDVLDTRQATESQVLLDTIRNGAIKKGSYLSFISDDSNSSVTVNGARIALPAGSLVKIRAGSDSTTGTVSLRGGNILGCSLADATLFVNGTQVAKGSFGNCNIPSVRQYHANLTFSVEPTYGEVRQLLINGGKILAGPGNNYIVISDDTYSPGNDLTVVAGPAYYEGTASGYSISPALIAGFTTISPTEGPAPLNVSFIDQSAGAPVSWSWDFGDGTGSRDKNPTHLYASPGTYDVSLTVNTADQTDTTTVQSEVIATPPRVVANFTARPLTGPVPFTVRFTDQSTGFPTSWSWTFQEAWNISFLSSGTSSPFAVSTDQNPVITFTDPGTYNVWLTVNNAYGSSDIVKNGYIVATPSPYKIPTNDILVQTGKPGYLEQNSSAQFVVSDTPAAITINGTYHDLPKGAVVRMVADSNQPGDITIDHNKILKFAFPDMEVYVNGELLDEGSIDSIYIPFMTQFQTGLSYYFAPASAQTLETINGQKYLASLDNAWIRIDNLGINSQGTLSLISATNSTSIEGTMNQTVQDWILG
ncbi:PKD domain containing protein [Methanoregula boonei 6A8]|uniref:PKD domain containing protein n=1 Tax=Methanoregula boonei (strain DSM 21154 / JCM 14090 / 6A8) TaxID=456442 RepID=A7IB22_METB6|nr:PKD domain-containing protein [Methanoregula boonei]ABS56933.1 PKD domain containing protein [Methanoregula boonei 6A8]